MFYLPNLPWREVLKTKERKKKHGQKQQQSTYQFDFEFTYEQDGNRRYLKTLPQKYIYSVDFKVFLQIFRNSNYFQKELNG